MLLRDGNASALVALVTTQRDGTDDTDAVKRCADAGVFDPMIRELAARLLATMRLGSPNILFADHHDAVECKEVDDDRARYAACLAHARVVVFARPVTSPSLHVWSFLRDR
jgi:hypothetical protein